MRTIAYYLRNSTEQQEYLYQIENLDKRFNTLANVEKLIYAEKISGFKSEKERPKMKQLLSDVDDGLISEIWVNDVTRLSRDAIYMQIIVKHCIEKNVNIFFDDRNLNTLSSNGEPDFTTMLLISILGQFSEANAKLFKSKGRQGKITKAHQNKYVGGFLPLGYTFDEITKEIYINNDERKLVEYIFDDYVNNNKSLLAVANDLNNLKNIDSIFSNKLKSNAIWRSSTVRAILKCKWYSLGIGSISKEEFQIKDELKFIDIDVYYSAINLLSGNKHKSKTHVHSYILNDLMYCSCGAKIYPKVNKEKNIYVCSTTIKRESDKSFKCVVDKQIQIEKLENAVWLLIKNKLDDFKIEITKKSNRENVIKSYIEINLQLIKSIEQITIENLNNQRERTISNFNKFGGSDIKLESDIKSIDNSIKIENKNISKLKSDIKLLETSIKNLDIAQEIKNNIIDIESDKNQIKYYCEKLISKIEIIGLKGSHTNVFKIVWNANINDDNNTYLVYNRTDDYYYINEVDEVSAIGWNNEKKLFIIVDLMNKIKHEVAANEIISSLNLNYDKSIDDVDAELSGFILSKENQFLNLIKAGQSKLKIVTPFI